MLKVAVGTPWTSPFMHTRYVDSVLDLRHPEGCETRFFRGRGWCPARMHTDLCERALAWKADIIIIIGPDQVYEEDLLERLIARYHQGHLLIGVMVPSRGHIDPKAKPFQPLAWRKRGDGLLELLTKDGTLQRADVIGTGVTMFAACLLSVLKRPWFVETILDETYQRIANQDSTFIHRLITEAHATLSVDTSIEVKHLHEFEIDDTFQDRFADWAEPGKGDPGICTTVKQ